MMGANLLTTTASLMCPHGGTVQITTGNTRVNAAGSPVVRAHDTYTVVGCPFSPGGSPHPCVQVQWLTTALRSNVTNDPPLLENSQSLCLAADQVPQGAAQISAAQARVQGG